VPRPAAAIAFWADPAKMAETGSGPEPEPLRAGEGVSNRPGLEGHGPPGPGGRDPASGPAAGAGQASRATGVVVHHRAGSPAAERTARLVAAEVRRAGLDIAAVRAVPTVPARRVIRFGRGENETAERLALRFQERWPHSWRLDASLGRDPTQSAPPLEIWLPHR
jgi:hypothetical protein